MRILTSSACVCVLVIAFVVAAGEPFEPASAGSRYIAPAIDGPLQPPAGHDGSSSLYVSGPFKTHYGTGVGGADESWVQTNLDMTIYGFGNQVIEGNRVADKFIVPQGEVWQIQGIDFFGYQTGSSTSSTMTSLNLRIWQGTPGAGGSVIWGDTTTNRMYSTWYTFTYRVLDTESGMVSDRPIMLLATDVSLALPPGTYWLDWQADGDPGLSGPWMPPITYIGQTTTGGALQSLDGGTTWAPIVDSGIGTPQGLPFDIIGFQVVPNDTCSSAQTITCPPTGGTVTVVGSTEGAIITEPPSCAGVSPWYPDVWYRITGTGAGITASTCSNYNLSADTQILVYNGSCSGLSCVAANDDDCPLQGPYLSTVSWDSSLGTDYYVAVTAEGQREQFGTDFELTITCEASCQTLAAPSVSTIGGVGCGGQTPETSPVLTWNDVAHESGYRWEVKDTFGVVVHTGTTGADVTSADVGTLAPGSYLVRVRALGDGASYCDGPWSSNCSFQVIEACDELPTPTIVSVGGASCGGQTQQTSPTLVWNDIADDSGYRWEIRDSFGNPVASGATGPNVTSANVGTLDPGDYIARIQAIGDGVEFCDSPWTAYCSFQVVGECDPLPVPAITAVGDTTCGGQTFDTSPMLQWSDVDHETGFRWQVRDTAGVPVASGSTSQNQTSVIPGSLEFGKYTARVQATGDGVNYCTSEWSSNCGFEIVSDIGVADFVWWPEQPKRGQKVRFADRATGDPTGWLWETDDGWTSTEENPFHRFQMTGEWDVSMTCQYAGGSDTKIWTVDVAGVITCGDGVCEGQETAWSCADDCGLPPEASGRAGGSDRRPSVPAAVGGVGGTGGTFWLTEGWIFNPNQDPLPLVIEYTPIGGTQIMTAGPFDLAPETGLYWENLVEDLFSTTGNGALWLDAPMPVHFLTRSYNQAANGSFGQAVRGLRDKLTIGKGDGEITLIGLRHDDVFRSNLFFQEVDGDWVTLEVEVFGEDGQRLRRTTFDVEGHSNLLRNLGSLGGGGQESAFVTVEVIAGDGRVNIVGSVVDQITGDPTTIDPIHVDQIAAKRGDGGSVAAETHHLVAVVAHTQGAANSVWGTRFVINSPIGTPDQNVRLVYIPEYDRTGVVGDRLERTTTIEGGHQLAWEDVMIDLFALPQSAKTQGALHVYSDAKLLINSRTYNRMAGGGTLGQLIKALSAGDLIDADHTGTIVGMSHNLDSRTNVGIAAFSDTDTEVELSFFSNFPALRSIGSITVSVPAQSHLQVTKIFEALGLDDTPLPSVHALVEVASGGSVYVYASMVDNATGDPTTIEATRN